MSLTKKEFAGYVKEYKFRELFNEMGWDNDKTSQPIAVDGTTYDLKAVAVKSGFKIFGCTTSNGLIPDYSIRKQIETKVTRLFQEHLIIFFDEKKQEQLWQLVVRQAGKPSKVTETRYQTTQDPELLYQRASGIFFELDEEEHITIVDVTKRVAENFHQNNERITKQFYDRFKKQHTEFIKFIKGIENKVNAEWYASLMLNRLMFCYFVQKKGFLDNNKNYLNDKLKQCQEKKGKDKFYSFYRNFLLQLFHQGLGAPDHSKSLVKEIGRIPYLNGGLFDEHELEKNNNKIEISDKAFDSIFKFFDEWEWHLDTRHTSSGKDINPDVIGYIFEKYINDRADMGAYYTKEDITDYISKNCIIPFLFEKAQSSNKDTQLWKSFAKSGRRYVYESIQHGVDLELPKDISIGIDNTDLRTDWNKSAPKEFALPSEIWREVIERRTRIQTLTNKIESCEIQTINDFITYNLNIRQFAIDCIANTDNPEWLKSFYQALNGVTIIDPTCGSGAFLFAAMNILEELYEQCIQRMENFVSEAPKGKFKFFEETINRIKSPEHPNLQYFIFKSIILNNLYGVDIMREAVEIAKLRLFLKLVASVDADYSKPNLGLEPLPDIDFNIRSGNTLVGFAKKNEIEYASKYLIDGADMIEPIEERSETVAMAFSRYKNIQLTHGEDYKSFKSAKDELNERLKELNLELNTLLHKQAQSIEYKLWLEKYKPFHWYSEFYEIIVEHGGFDIIIGNPPYVEYSKVRKDYVLKDYVTQQCGNLFGFVSERAKQIISNDGYLSLIVPISVICTQRMATVQRHIFNQNSVWLSNYGERPSKLFTGAEVLLTIFIVAPELVKPQTYTTTFIKWKAEERPILFTKLHYIENTFKPKEYTIPKIGFSLENTILQKIHYSKKSLAHDLVDTNKHRIYYRIGGGRYWKIFTDFSPRFILNGKNSTSSRENYLYAKSEQDKKAMIAVLSSSIFYWYFILTTNCRDLNPSDLKEFPISISDFSERNLKTLASLSDKLMADYSRNSELKEKVSGKTGNITYQEFYPRLSKEVIDKVDEVIGEQYGFTDTEMDFVINYDIKYRMGGKETDND